MDNKIKGKLTFTDESGNEYTLKDVEVPVTAKGPDLGCLIGLHAWDMSKSPVVCLKCGTKM